MFLFWPGLLITGLFGLASMPPEAGTPGNLALSFITFGFIMVALAGLRLYRGRGEGRYLEDERTRRIGAWGLSMVLVPDLHRPPRSLLAGPLWNLVPGCRHPLCPAHPGDGNFCQGIPGMALQEEGM